METKMKNEELTFMIATDVRHALRLFKDYKVAEEYQPKIGRVKVYSDDGYTTSTCFCNVQKVVEYYIEKYYNSFNISYGISYDEDLQRAIIDIIVIGESE